VKYPKEWRKRYTLTLATRSSPSHARGLRNNCPCPEGSSTLTVRSQSGHSQVTVRSTVRPQSGLVNYKHSEPGANSIKIYSFLLKIEESQFVLVFTRTDCDLTVDLTVT